MAVALQQRSLVALVIPYDEEMYNTLLAALYRSMKLVHDTVLAALYRTIKIVHNTVLSALYRTMEIVHNTIPRRRILSSYTVLPLYSAVSYDGERYSNRTT